MRVFIGKHPGYQDERLVFPFVRTLITYLDRAGIAHTFDSDDHADVALCVQWEPGVDTVRRFVRRAVPVVHRLDGRARALVKAYDNDEHNRCINRLATWTVFQSEYVRRHTCEPCETIFGLEAPICESPERGSIIYNGVDRSVFHERGDRRRLKGKFNVLHVAFSAGIRKGAGDLAAVASMLASNPDIHFHALGRQAQDVAFGHLLQDLPNVSLLGVQLDRTELATLMRSCDVLFFPSRNDYCPNTVLEAMSCGLPVWYHPSGGTPELVRDHEIVAGVPMDKSNPVYPLHVLRECQGEFSQRAVAMVEKRFRMERVGAEYVSLFERLIANAAITHAVEAA